MLDNELYAEAQSRGLDTTEAQGVIEILSDPQVKEALEKAENLRKIKVGIYLIVVAIAVYLIVSTAAAGTGTVKVNGVPRPTNVYDGVFMAGVVWVILTGLLFATFKTKTEKNAKTVVISRFLSIIAPNSKFSADDVYGFDFSNLVRKGMLSSYDRVDTREDSFEFTHEKDGKSIKVNGLEIRTSEMRGSWKNRKRVTTNQCFLIKGTYPDTKFKIDKPVRIKGDLADSLVFKLTTFAIPAVLMPIMAKGHSGLIPEFFSKFPNPLMAGIIAGVIAGIVVSFIANLFVNHNRVKLENVAFEKIFDVNCEDQIMSRMVLTPAFMDRLVTFVGKTGGKYEFFFEDENLYVKKILNGWFLEINALKNIKSNSKMFIRWFAEIKEVASLITDTGVLVFARTDYVAAARSQQENLNPTPNVGIPEINPLSSSLPRIP